MKYTSLFCICFISIYKIIVINYVLQSSAWNYSFVVGLKKLLEFFFNQNGDTALTIAKSRAHNFYKKLMDQIDQIDQNSKFKLSQIWK